MTTMMLLFATAVASLCCVAEAHRVEGMAMAMGDIFISNADVVGAAATAAAAGVRSLPVASSSSVMALEVSDLREPKPMPHKSEKGQNGEVGEYGEASEGTPFRSLVEANNIEGSRSLVDISPPLSSFVQSWEDESEGQGEDDQSTSTSENESFPFAPIRFAGIAKAMRKFRSGGSSSLGCGEPLVKKWYVKDSDLVEDSVKFMSAKDAWKKAQSKEDKKVVGSKKLESLVPPSKRQEAYWMPKKDDDHYWAYRGLKVIRINDKPVESDADVSKAVKESSSEAKVKVELEVGMDFRGCWGNLHDRGSRKDEARKQRHVCGKDVMENLIDELESLVPKENKMGQDESVVIDNLDDFVLKTAKNLKEIKLIAKVAQNVRNYVLWAEHEHRMWTTSLAPICGIISMPGLAQWVVMRKVAIPAANYAKTVVDGKDVGMWELKGPKYASIKDGKTWSNRVFGSSSRSVWEARDAGFAEAFPHGLRMLGCGSYDAQQVFLQDVRFLGANDMTDYSLLANMYYEIADMQEDCCGTPGAPLFPIALKTEKFALAFGISDWYEQTVRSGIKQYFSTMDRPSEFQAAFSAMWGTYFLPKKVDVDKEDSTKSKVVFKKDGLCEMTVGIGTPVTALQDLSWKDHKENLIWDKAKDTVEFDAKLVYTQPYQRQNSRNTTNGILRIPAGTAGILEAGAHHMEPQAVTVRWEIQGETPTSFLALVWGSQLAEGRLPDPRFDATNSTYSPDAPSSGHPAETQHDLDADTERAAGRDDMDQKMRNRGSLVVVIIVGIVAAAGLLAFFVAYSLGLIGSNRNGSNQTASGMTVRN